MVRRLLQTRYMRRHSKAFLTRLREVDLAKMGYSVSVGVPWRMDDSRRQLFGSLLAIIYKLHGKI